MGHRERERKGGGSVLGHRETEGVCVGTHTPRTERKTKIEVAKLNLLLRTTKGGEGPVRDWATYLVFSQEKDLD